jgi:regulator of sirC expression with transglutaminase-like and TPR domain
MTGVPLEEVALSIASEFGPIDAEHARRELNRLAFELGPIESLAPQTRVQRLIEKLGGDDGFEVPLLAGPADLMLDRVLQVRRGHPVALAIVYAAVARRAGFALHPVGNERVLMLGDQSAEPALAVDPVPGGRRPPRQMHWMCPHLVASILLRALSVCWREQGDLRRAIRALELRLLLPLARPARARHERELVALQATLN